MLTFYQHRGIIRMIQKVGVNNRSIPGLGAVQFHRPRTLWVEEGSCEEEALPRLAIVPVHRVKYLRAERKKWCQNKRRLQLQGFKYSV